MLYLTEDLKQTVKFYVNPSNSLQKHNGQWEPCNISHIDFLLVNVPYILWSIDHAFYEYYHLVTIKLSSP